MSLYFIFSILFELGMKSLFFVIKPYPGLHQKQRGQQVKGGDSALLLCSGENPPEVLCPALEPSAPERHGPVGAGPEEGHEDGQRDEAALL